MSVLYCMYHWSLCHQPGCADVLLILVKPKPSTKQWAHTDNNNLIESTGRHIAGRGSILPREAIKPFSCIKNDTQFLEPKHVKVFLDPVVTFSDYITRTESNVVGVLSPVNHWELYQARTEKERTDDAMFLSRRHPFVALLAAPTAQILEESIVLAGLAGLGSWGNSPRSPVATVAIAMGSMPMSWALEKNIEVFINRYVHSKTPYNFAAKIWTHQNRIVSLFRMSVWSVVR